MSIHATDLARLLIALTVLILFAHVSGYLFSVLRQPPVVGEILAGLLLGPTVLGALAPQAMAMLVPRTGITWVSLGVIYQLGQILLMFVAGTELRIDAQRGERKTAFVIALVGMLIPFVAGLLVIHFVDYSSLMGPRGSQASVKNQRKKTMLKWWIRSSCKPTTAK